jgi:hypothetical protein
MGRASLLTVMAAAFVFGIMNLNIHRSVEGSVGDMVRYYNESVARVIANEGMCYILSQLSDGSTLRVNSPKSLPTNLFADMGPYSGSYMITDDSITVSGAQKKVIKLLLYATYSGYTDTVLVYADPVFGYTPEVIRGAFTANDAINNTISDMVIDGRDHDLAGNLIPNKGVMAVSTSVEFQNTENAAIGGTDASNVDHAPSYPENPLVIEQNYNWGGAFPSSPDTVLAYPEGKLKSIAQSGVGGSQYVTDPKNVITPLRGVTYVELAPGVTWNVSSFGDNPQGILVVHNSSSNARIVHLNTGKKNTPFRGIIIADYAFHLHIDIIGAIILLSNQLEKTKECAGNKDHKVLFSNEAVMQATGIATNVGTGWQGRVPIIGWRE